MHRAALFASTVLAFGCAPPRVDFAPLRPGVCAEEQVPCDEGHAWVEVTRDFEPRTLVYVIDTLSIPVADGEGRVAGFDLDGTDSGEGTDAPDAPCGEARADYVSSVDPNVQGVDNQLQLLVPVLEGLLEPASCPGEVTDSCFEPTLQRAVDEGRMLYLIELSGIESFDTDPWVEIALYEAMIVAPGAPLLGPDGRLAAGQTFAGTLLSRATGTILGGRFAVAGTSFPIDLDLGAFELPLDLVSAEIRFDVGEEALVRGVIGGAFAPYVVPPVGGGTECGILPEYADMSLDRDRCCEAPGACCNALSAGLTFTATRAELRP